MLQTLKRFFTGDELGDSIRHAMDEGSWTPDRLLIELSSDYVFVFEYGDMQTGMLHHKMLQSEESFVGYTMDRYYLWTKRQGDFSYPIALNKGVLNQPRLKVRGELHKIPSWNLRNLDRHRQNGVQFIRKKRRILLETVGNNGKHLAVNAWVYIGLPSYWEEPLEWDNSFYRERPGASFVRCGDYADHKRPEVKRYSHFNRNELQSNGGKCFLFTKGEPLGIEDAK